MSSENSGKHFATSSSQGGEILEINNDDEVLNNLGYEQHMKRGFNFWSMTAFCLTGLGLLPSLGGTLWFSLGYLGLMPMTWGWLVASFFIMFEVLSLAEMSSAMPTSGGLTFRCAPVRIRKLASYVTAWCMIASASLGGASFYMTQANMIQALVVMFNADFSPNEAYVYLFHVGVSVDMTLLASYFGPKQRFWLTSGLAHLAEETEDAANVVPRAMWVSCLTVAVLGYIFNVVLAFAATDIDAIFESPLGQPLGAILVLAMGNGSLTKVLWICTVLSNFGVVFVCNAAATRIYFAYARDGALPFAKWLSHVNRTTRTPVNATIALSTVFALIGLISLGSTTALQAFFSGSSISGAIAYLMPVLMRCINENNPDYKPGPFNLGKWSRPVRLVACIWTIFTLPLFSFPDSPNPDATTFNWSIAFNGGLFLIVLPWYFFKARKTFHGPGAKDFSQ
ncbi:putative Amino acid permease/ SLC12A domain-containing protein [Seiridium unicorne]|uniref:Amino acid permease/ SLC12A domain-containing protein n=1 Tax=Seiridium unicorne TaxID=138068 RepID=A0ABR2VDA5_9PEZI